jgi:membrane-associated phospholipid phosphatase
MTTINRGISLLGLLAALAVAEQGRAQVARPDSTLRQETAVRADTVIPDRQLFHRSDLYVAGGFVVGTIALLPFDARLADALRDEQAKGNRAIDQIAHTAKFFGGPGPIIIGSTMYVVGRFGHVPRLAELALHGTEAVGVGAAIATGIKIVAGRARPYVSADTNPRDFGFGRGLKDDRNKSFPSGHATAAFSAAAAVVTETHEWWPQSTWYVAPIMYGGATVVGLSRMYDDQHWASDVLMGAAIGTFAGLKTVRFNHTHTGNKIDQILLGARLVPTPNGTAVAWGGSF